MTKDLIRRVAAHKRALLLAVLAATALICVARNVLEYRALPDATRALDDGGVVMCVGFGSSAPMKFRIAVGLSLACAGLIWQRRAFLVGSCLSAGWVIFEYAAWLSRGIRHGSTVYSTRGDSHSLLFLFGAKPLDIVAIAVATTVLAWYIGKLWSLDWRGGKRRELHA